MSELRGKIIVIGETQSFGSNGFTKREFVVETSEQYSQSIQFECHKDKCALLDNFNVGQETNISFDVKGRKWTNPEGIDKYFNSLVAWKIDAIGGAQEPAQATTTDDDPLPF